ncbi:hypothetical protein WJX82_001321 [Trebouxia sp. C0006]
MRHRKWVSVVAFAAVTAVGCVVVRKLRQRGKPASDEPKRRTPKHPEGPTTGARSKADSLCSHPLSGMDDSEAIFKQDGDDGPRFCDWEWTAHPPEDAHEEDNAVCSFSLDGEVTTDVEATAPHAAPVNTATPLPSWPDLTGDARVHNPEKGPPVDKIPQSVGATHTMLPTSDANSQQQDAAASQPSDLFSASAGIVVPQAPMEIRAGADKDSPWGRLPRKFPDVRAIKGDGNCFYRAKLAAVVEGLCRDPRPAHIAALSKAFTSQQLALKSCPIVNHGTREVAIQGHNFLQDMLKGISRHGNTWDDMLVFLNQLDIDRAMVQFLRAVTARELWANQPEYDVWVAGIDKYRNISFPQIIQLPMNAEAEQLQVRALSAVLPVCLKMLDTAGGKALYTQQLVDGVACFNSNMAKCVKHLRMDHQQVNGMLSVGDKLQDFPDYYRVLQKSTGGGVALSSLEKKKPVVLFFYPKAGTPGCTKEACKFRDEYGKFVDAEAEVFGISSDTTEANAAFAQKERLPFPLLTDQSDFLRKSFGIKADLFGMLKGRQTFVIDKNGKCVMSFNDQMGAEKHVDEALQVVKTLV